MSITQPTRPAPQTRTETRPDQAKRDADALLQVLDRTVEYVPFLAKDSIKLSARMVLDYLCTPTKSGKVCDERMAQRFVMLCKARGLNPWEGDAYIVGYDGKDGPQFSLITAHQAFLKRAEVHPEYDGIQSGVLLQTKDGETLAMEGDYFPAGFTIVGGWATVHLKHRKHPMHKRLKLATFSTGRSRWQVDPAGMIVKCAEADALRSAFPNSLGGMYLHSEQESRELESLSQNYREPEAPAAPINLRMPKAVENGNTHEPSPAAETPAPAAAHTEPDAGDEVQVSPPDENQAEAMDRQDMVDAFTARIGAAETAGEVGQVLDEAHASEEFIGPFYGERLRTFGAKRMEELKGVQVAKAKR